MKHFSTASLAAFLVATAFLWVPASAQEMIAPAAIPCTSCHNAGTLIVSKQAQFHHSKHGSGEAYLRGTSADCAGCHGSESAEARIEAGLSPHDASVQGVVNVSPYTCRTCHDIHTTYTTADFSLTGDAAPVELEMTGTRFDGGDGNLCANCHQIRNELPVATNGQIEVTDTRFGTHHGVEAQMLLGEGSLGFRSRPSSHYREVKDTCVGCHMGEARNHTFEPDLANCQGCHQGLDTFDREGVQTDVQAMLDKVKALLIARGIMNEENRSIPGTYPEEVASAMWNYIFVIEDQSKGVHNPDFAKALLQYAIDRL
jgi:hypothetical protein